MAFPVPEPGLVISFAYLWQPEYETGREEGVKDRPCVIVIRVQDVDGFIGIRSHFAQPRGHWAYSGVHYGIYRPPDLHALTPLFWTHVNPYGRFDLDMRTRITTLA